MKHEFAYEEAQRHLAQRNRFAALAAMLGLTSLIAIGAAATREESVVLVPVTAERLTLTSGALEAHYLELVTRDTALMLLNRAPESLDYWMEQVIARMEVDPGALTATVTGTLKTFVGAQVIASQQRSFAFTWRRRGLSLGLTGFRQLPDPQENQNKDQDQ